MKTPNKILIPLYGQEVAPRFDLTAEAVIVTPEQNGPGRVEKFIVLPQVSAEKLCHLILTEGIGTVICGGIEEEYYQYLTWKRIQVIDSVIGPLEAVIDRFVRNELTTGDIVADNSETAE